MKTPNALRLSSQDMEAQVVLLSNAKQISVDSVMVVGMTLLCLSFLAIFMVPVALEKRFGLAVATEAMEGVWFQIFVVMDSLSFFPSLGLVLVLVQVMGMNTITKSQMKRVTSVCSIVGYIAMGSATVAVVAAAFTFMSHP